MKAIAIAAILSLSAGGAFAQQQQQQGQPLDEPTARALVGELGYEVKEIERSFLIDATRDGNEVQLRVDADTGQVFDAEKDMLVQESAKRTAEQQGFEQVGQLEQQEDAFVGTAKKGGEDVKIKVDAKTGEVQTMD